MTQQFLDKYIDKGLHHAIKALNEKGYTTQYCCEGHYEEDLNCYYGAYIAFIDPLPKSLFPNLPTFPWKEDGVASSKYKTPFMTFGMGYKNNFSDVAQTRILRWVGTRYKRMSRAEKDAEHERFLQELNEWADSLPRKERRH